MNPPALWVLKRITGRKTADRFGIFINFCPHAAMPGKRAAG
jgi:hypothetical protein